MTIPNVIGLDLSISATGIAGVGGEMHTAGGDAKLGDSRLEVIRNAVWLELRPLYVDLVVIEDLPTHAHGAGITGMVHGVIRHSLLCSRIPYALVPPAVLKKYATGKGNATKADMRMALYQRTGLDVRDDNQVDAWWLRAMGYDHVGTPVVTVPKAQREQLTKVKWGD